MGCHFLLLRLRVDDEGFSHQQLLINERRYVTSLSGSSSLFFPFLLLLTRCTNSGFTCLISVYYLSVSLRQQLGANFNPPPPPFLQATPPPLTSIGMVTMVRPPPNLGRLQGPSPIPPACHFFGRKM